MRKYELVVILRNSLSESERKKSIDTIKGWIKNITVEKEDAWGEKAFAYPVKKERSGYYYVFLLEGEAIPSDFEKKLYGNDSVLRHLVIRTK